MLSVNVYSQGRKERKKKGGGGQQEGLPCLKYSRLSSHLKIYHGIGSPSLRYRVTGRTCMGNTLYGRGMTKQSNHCINKPVDSNKSVLTKHTKHIKRRKITPNEPKTSEEETPIINIKLLTKTPGQFKRGW